MILNVPNVRIHARKGKGGDGDIWVAAGDRVAGVNKVCVCSRIYFRLLFTGITNKGKVLLCTKVDNKDIQNSYESWVHWQQKWVSTMRGVAQRLYSPSSLPTPPRFRGTSQRPVVDKGTRGRPTIIRLTAGLWRRVADFPFSRHHSVVKLIGCLPLIILSAPPGLASPLLPPTLPFPPRTLPNPTAPSSPSSPSSQLQ